MVPNITYFIHDIFESSHTIYQWRFGRCLYATTVFCGNSVFLIDNVQNSSNFDGIGQFFDYYFRFPEILLRKSVWKLKTKNMIRLIIILLLVSSNTFAQGLFKLSGEIQNPTERKVLITLYRDWIGEEEEYEVKLNDKNQFLRNFRMIGTINNTRK